MIKKQRIFLKKSSKKEGYLTLKPPLTVLVMNLKKLTTTGIAKVPKRTTGNQDPKEVVNADA